jgi:hypothetical protein
MRLDELGGRQPRNRAAATAAVRAFQRRRRAERAAVLVPPPTESPVASENPEDRDERFRELDRLIAQEDAFPRRRRP